MLALCVLSCSCVVFTLCQVSSLRLYSLTALLKGQLRPLLAIFRIPCLCSPFIGPSSSHPYVMASSFSRLSGQKVFILPFPRGYRKSFSFFWIIHILVQVLRELGPRGKQERKPPRHLHPLHLLLKIFFFWTFCRKRTSPYS